MSPKDLRVGVVGVGYLGSIHVSKLKNFQEVKEIIVWDIKPERMEEAREKYGAIPASSLDEVVEKSDAVICASPTTTHYEVVKFCIEMGKPVFVEKPLTDDIKKAEEIVRMSKEKGVKVQVGHIERFNPAFLSAKSLISEKPYFIESVRMSMYNPRGTDVDVILDLMIHDIDLTLNLIKEMPENISAIGVPVLTDEIDIANVRLEFPSGALANLTASRISLEKMRKFRVFTKENYLSIDLLHRKVEMVKRMDGEILPYFPPVDGSLDALSLEIRSFLDAVIYDKPVEVSVEEGYRNMLVANMIRKGIEERLKRILG
ncbi:MAG: Gfo/Idh/MocA family oxidoreductase [Candidatus Caldipriscus sp.]|nr:Gfo/Idh/MocA family oxidoreductase [Candidatus Caldipriscus sp.]